MQHGISRLLIAAVPLNLAASVLATQQCPLLVLQALIEAGGIHGMRTTLTTMRQSVHLHITSYCMQSLTVSQEALCHGVSKFSLQAPAELKNTGLLLTKSKLAGSNWQSSNVGLAAQPQTQLQVALVAHAMSGASFDML